MHLWRRRTVPNDFHHARKPRFRDALFGAVDKPRRPTVTLVNQARDPIEAHDQATMEPNELRLVERRLQSIHRGIVEQLFSVQLKANVVPVRVDCSDLVDGYPAFAVPTANPQSLYVFLVITDEALPYKAGFEPFGQLGDVGRQLGMEAMVSQKIGKPLFTNEVKGSCHLYRVDRRFGIDQPLLERGDGAGFGAVIEPEAKQDVQVAWLGCSNGHVLSWPL